MSILSQCSRDLVSYQPRTASVGTAGAQAFTHSGTTKKRCQIQPRGSFDNVIVEQREYVITHVLYFASDPGTSHGDQFTVVEPAGLKDKVLEQVGKAVDQTGLGRLWRVECEERERDQ